ncbi:uncharacterized protein LOC127725337 [Mytilus californianus]|uniref:uncharacterized protein LOC127725337 n=1 Tax=Mytilus californianus TaxID=6549 RepID=UPI002246548B|nr:uncharacterized protein LOC127725337 [Mytilus californianus]
MLLLVIKWILLIVKVSECVIDTCNNNDKTTPTRVAKMCQSTSVVEEDEDGNATFDGVFLSLIEHENNCSCSVSVKNTNSFVNLFIKRLNNFTEQSLCGVVIDIYHIRPNDSILPENFPINCSSTEQTQVFSLLRNEYIQFTSRVVDVQLSVGYCIQITRDHNAGQEVSSLEISCGNQALATTIDTPIHAQTTFSDTSTNPQTTFSDITTHPQASLSDIPTQTQTTHNDFKTSEQITSFMSSPTPMINTSNINDKTNSDGDSTLYIAIGAGGGFVLFVTLLVLIVLCKRRKSHHSDKGENSANPRASSAADSDDDDGLKYNVLYVSSERHADIDVNYSTADGDIPRHISGEDDGDYSTVDDNKNIQDSSLYTHQVTNTAVEVNEDNGVEHINAPTESGCVYAVVDKSHKTNSSVKNIETASTSATYAVVNKRRVTPPDEGNK